jgi:hypothetical protein
MSQHRRLLPIFALLALLALTVGISACGAEHDSNHVEEGQPLELGELHYNVTFSRYLNPNDPEDEAYLVGQPEAPKGASYFGVFFEVQNESEHTLSLPSELKITDADGEEYEVIESESIFALPLGEELEGEEQMPILDSPAQLGAIEGSLAIFLLPAEASENRPLTLHIPGGESEEKESGDEHGGGGEVVLDL